jgi:hypothetical protein
MTELRLERSHASITYDHFLVRVFPGNLYSYLGHTSLNKALSWARF